MGTKRIGLARMEALMEALKREITGFNVEVTANANTQFTVSGSRALVRNTINLINVAGTLTMTLPAAADCGRGDVIIVKYIAATTNGAVHKYGTSGEFLAGTSLVYGQSAAAGEINTVLAQVPNGSSRDCLNITGAINGTGGIGTVLRFHFDGTQWAVNGQLEKQGSGLAATTAVFDVS